MNRREVSGSDSKETHIFERNRYISCLLLFISALGLKLFVFFTSSQPIIFSKYPFFADQINKGINIGERIVDLSPLYLYGTVWLQKIYGSNWEAMTVWQFIAGSLNVVLVFLIGEKIFNRAVGLVAAILLMLYGNLILFEMTLEPDSFILFLNSLFILMLLGAEGKAPHRQSSLVWIAAGLVLGLSIITKANALLFLPGVVLWISRISIPRKEKILAAILLFLGASLMILPITGRNYITLKDPVLITADFGKVFFHGNGPGATGMERADLPDQGFIEESGGEPDYAHVMFREAARKITGRNLKPSESSRFWFLQTIDYQWSHPYSALKLLVKKSLLFWLNYEVHDLDTNYAYYQNIRTWPLLPFGLISALGLVGIVLAWKNNKQVYWPIVVIVVYLLTVIIFFNASRYRLPAVPFLALFAAYTLFYLSNLFKEKHFKKSFFVLGSIILILIFNFLFLKKKVDTLDRWQQATRVHYNLGGNALLRKGNYKMAIVEYKKAIALAPDFAPAYNQLGKSYALLNDLATAEKYFFKVVELAPRVDQGYMNLGFLYKLKGDNLRALSFFEKAYLINPRNLKVQEQLKGLKNPANP